MSYKSTMLNLFQQPRASSAYLMDAIKLYPDCDPQDRQVIREYFSNSGEQYVRGFAEEHNLTVTDCMFE